MEINFPFSKELYGSSNQRVRIDICGVVQGVGFRPFIYKLANALQLTGWIVNSSQGVTIEAEGPPEQLKKFLLRIKNEQASSSCLFNSLASMIVPSRTIARPSASIPARRKRMPPWVICMRDSINPMKLWSLSAPRSVSTPSRAKPTPIWGR